MFSRFKAKRAAYSVYLFSEFTLSLLFSMMFVVDGVYQVSTVGLNALQLVLVGTTLEISAFLFEVPTGVIADVYSRRLSIIIGMFVMGLGFVIEGSFPFFAPILLAQVIWGLGYTFTSGATEAWIADEVGEERAGKAFLRASQIGTIGSLIGIGAGALIGTLGVNIPIVLGGLGVIGVGALLIFIMPETGFKPTPRENRNTFQSMVHTFKSGLRVVRGKPVLINILTIGLILGLYSEGYDRLWAAHLLENITLPTIGELQPVMWFGIIRGSRYAVGPGCHRVHAAARRYRQTRAGSARDVNPDHRDGGGIAGVCADGQLRHRRAGAVGLLVAAADGGAVVHHVGQSTCRIERACDSHLDVQSDRCAGADSRRADRRRDRFGAGHSRFTDDLCHGAGDGAAAVDQDDTDRSASGSCRPRAGCRRSGRYGVVHTPLSKPGKPKGEKNDSIESHQ